MVVLNLFWTTGDTWSPGITGKTTSLFCYLLIQRFRNKCLTIWSNSILYVYQNCDPFMRIKYVSVLSTPSHLLRYFDLRFNDQVFFI